MITITKEFSFIAAHRIEGHSKCGRLHGHNYRMEVTLGHPKGDLSVPELDISGFVLDFAVVKEVIKPIIDQLDHRYLVSRANVDAGDIYYAAAFTTVEHKDDCFLMSVQQTSAELLARWFHDAFTDEFHDKGLGHILVVEVKLWETPTAYATF